MREVKAGEPVYVRMTYLGPFEEDTDYLRLSMSNYLEVSFWEGSMAVLTINKSLVNLATKEKL